MILFEYYYSRFVFWILQQLDQCNTHGCCWQPPQGLSCWTDQQSWQQGVLAWRQATRGLRNSAWGTHPFTTCRNLGVLNRTITRAQSQSALKATVTVRKPWCLAILSILLWCMCRQRVATSAKLPFRTMQCQSHCARASLCIAWYAFLFRCMRCSSSSTMHHSAHYLLYVCITTLGVFICLCIGKSGCRVVCI